MGGILPTQRLRRQACRFGATAAVLLIIGVDAVGCSGASNRDITLPPRNLAQQSNPLDPYVYVNEVAGAYAEDLLAAGCMTAHGYEWTVPWRDVRDNKGESFNSAGYRLFDLDIAERYGYHVAPPTEAANPGWEAYTTKVISDVEHDQFMSCLQQVRPNVKTPSMGTLNLASALKSVAADQADETDEVKQATKKWRECMLPQGIADLPETPIGMPSPSLAARFGLSGGDGGSSATAVASRDEIVLATTDAQCQESSGYAKVRYDAVWDLSVAQLTENYDELLDAKRQIDTYNARVTEVIAQNAPQK